MSSQDLCTCGHPSHEHRWWYRDSSACWHTHCDCLQDSTQRPEPVCGDLL